MANIGDQIQILTIDYLYEQMGVEKKDILYIDHEDLSTYNGPPVMLPVSMPLINSSSHGMATMFSDNIKPVFFGLTMAKDTLDSDEISYYKKFEPIGCRDEKAYTIMQKYGIHAYLGGCLTVALPKRRKNSKKQNKVFIVDIPEGLKKFIPNNIEKDAEYGTHIIYGNVSNAREICIERYQQYKDEARVVITGLLHGAVPCMAFGIPVILARDYVSYRFGWVESLLNIYTPSQYADIDWSPDSLNIEDHKKVIRELFAKRMRGENADDEITYLNRFYMNRDKNEYVNDVFMTTKKFIDDTWVDRSKSYEYAVWGITQVAELTIDYISKYYPNAILRHVYDKNVNKSLRGIHAINPNNIIDYPREVIFVTAAGAAEAAKELFNKINKPKHLYSIFKIIR